MKTLVRRLSRFVFQRFRVRGRHRFADRVGPRIAPREIEIVDIGGIRFPVNHAFSVYRHAYYGIYEEDNVRFLRSLARSGDVCIDAGANIGYLTSVLAASIGPTGRVFAFEPSRSCLRALEFLDEVPNVEVLPDALGAAGGVVAFFDTERAITKGYAFVADLRDDPGDAIRYDVMMRSLDDFCTERSISHVRLLKLDIEGSELAALRGAAGLLQDRAIDYILLEMSFRSTSDEEERDSQITHLLGAAGYTKVARHGRDEFWKSPTVG